MIKKLNKQALGKKLDGATIGSNRALESNSEGMRTSPIFTLDSESDTPRFRSMIVRVPLLRNGSEIVLPHGQNSSSSKELMSARD